MKWLRERYGWQAKKQEWATLGVCLFLLAALLIAVAQAA
jgi:hypothetical protein